MDEKEEKKHGNKHSLSFYHMSDSVPGALYTIKHLLLMKDPLSRYYSNPSFIHEKKEE